MSTDQSPHYQPSGTGRSLSPEPTLSDEQVSSGGWTGCICDAYDGDHWSTCAIYVQSPRPKPARPASPMQGDPQPSTEALA